MKPSCILIGLAALVFGAVGQKQYRPGGSSGGNGGGSSGSSSSGGGQFNSPGRPGSSGGFGGGSSGSSSGGGSQFNSPGRPGGSGGFGGGDNQGNDFGGSGGNNGAGSGSLEDAIPGVPGDDYPIYAEVPESSFVCDGQVDGGYYADPEAECQVFHICANDGNGGLTKYSFLCPNGTIFDQQYFVCTWWFNVDCSLAEELYTVNNDIAAEREASNPAGDESQEPVQGGSGSKRGGQRGQGGSIVTSKKGGQSGKGGSSATGQRVSSAGRGSTGGSSGSSSNRSEYRGSSNVQINASRKGSSGGSRRGTSGSKNVSSGSRRTGSKNKSKDSSSSKRGGSKGGSQISSGSGRRQGGSQGSYESSVSLGSGIVGVGAPGFGGEGGFEPSSEYGAPGGIFVGGVEQSQGSFGASQSLDTGYGAPGGGSFGGEDDYGDESPLTSYGRNSRDIEYVEYESLDEE